MQNGEYLERLKEEWQKLLKPEGEVTPEEIAELREILKEQEEKKDVC